MRAKQFTTEAAIGTHPKRPSREGSRPERGHEPQKRYVTDRKTGKQYDPDEEFDKLKNSPEFQVQMKCMAQKEGFDYTMKDLDNDYAGFPSNYSMKHKMLKRIKPEKHQLYKDKMNNMHEFDDLLKLFKVAQTRGDVIEQGVAEGSLEEYGDTAKGQKMLTKVQKRAVDRVVSKKAETDPKYAKRNSDTANRAWDRMSDLDEIAGAFPSPSTRKHWADQAALSNAAEAQRQAQAAAAANAERLKKNTELVDKEQKTNYHSLDGVAVPPKNEATSNAMANTAKRLTDPNDGKTTKLRAAGDKKREEHLKSRDIAKKNEGQVKTLRSMEEAMERIGKELEEAGKASRALCTGSRPDSDLGASNLASCKSQGLRARDGKKSHKLGKTSKSRVVVGGHRIKGAKYGGPLPDWS